MPSTEQPIDLPATAPVGPAPAPLGGTAPAVGPAGAPAVAPPVAPLRRNADFQILAVSQGISAVGDAVSATALPLLVLALTGSGLAMGIVGAIQTVADFLFGMVAGAIADRSDRKRMLFGADAGRAIVTALIPLSVILHGPTMAVIIVVAGPLSVLRGVFRAGYIAAIPNLVGRPLLARGNAVLESVYSMAFIVGPAIAGLLSGAIGPGPTLGIDALSFGLSSLGLFLIRRDLRPPADRPPGRIVDDIREGIVYVARHPLLRSAVAVFAVGSAVLAPMTSALTFRIVRDLGQDPATFGLVLTIYGVGTLVGSILATRLRPRTNVALVLVLAFAAMGVGLVGIALVASIVAVALFAGVAGAGEVVLVVTYVTVRAANSPDHLLGRIAGTARVAALGLQPFAMLAAGGLIDSLGGTATCAILGLGMLGCAVAILPSQTLRETTIAPRQDGMSPAAIRLAEDADPARLV